MIKHHVLQVSPRTRRPERGGCSGARSDHSKIPLSSLLLILPLSYSSQLDIFTSVLMIHRDMEVAVDLAQQEHPDLRVYGAYLTFSHIHYYVCHLPINTTILFTPPLFYTLLISLLFHRLLDHNLLKMKVEPQTQKQFRMRKLETKK